MIEGGLNPRAKCGIRGPRQEAIEGRGFCVIDKRRTETMALITVEHVPMTGQ
jgi:hypothetical protein